ncbi:hypothetical protein N7513_004703 [Penicillium frequentans]|nr:hypothetical protein N7513_004703 [Penicillium glabrum]
MSDNDRKHTDLIANIQQSINVQAVKATTAAGQVLPGRARPSSYREALASHVTSSQSSLVSKWLTRAKTNGTVPSNDLSSGRSYAKMTTEQVSSRTVEEQISSIFTYYAPYHIIICTSCGCVVFDNQLSRHLRLLHVTPTGPQFAHKEVLKHFKSFPTRTRRSNDLPFPSEIVPAIPGVPGKRLLRADSAGNVLRIRKQWVLDEIEEPVCQGLKLSAATLQTEGILVTYSTK